METVTAVDPGYEQSAMVVVDTQTACPQHHVIVDNEALLTILRTTIMRTQSTLVLEQMESFGKAVGREVLETVFITGRFAEAWYPRPVVRLPRRTVKMHLCHANHVSDAHIRQALIDRFGATRDRAIGTKQHPGPLYGIKHDEWAALALAVTFVERREAWYEPVASSPPVEF